MLKACKYGPPHQYAVLLDALTPVLPHPPQLGWNHHHSIEPWSNRKDSMQGREKGESEGETGRRGGGKEGEGKG